MTSQQIEYVLAVAEERSFSRAARKLFVTQPTLSKFIINLEANLGVTLFDRSSSPITVTEAGNIFIETANQMKNLEKDMTVKMSDLIGLKNGLLKIGTSPFYASNMLLKTIINFHERYPELQISVMEDFSSALEHNLLKGNLDIVIGTSSFDEELFGIEELCLEKLYFAVPAEKAINKKYGKYAITAEDIKNNSDRLFTCEGINLNMFSKERFIFQNNSELSSHSIMKICRSHGFTPNISFGSNNLETVFAFVSSGLGVAFIPDTYIKFSGISKHPIYYSIDNLELESHIKLIYKKNKYLSKATIAFSNTLKELIGMGTWK